MTTSNTQSPSTTTLSTVTEPGTPERSTPTAQPWQDRRFAADLGRLEASIPPVHLDRIERDTLRRQAKYPSGALHACAELAADPVCVMHHITFSPMSVVEEKLRRAEEAERFARSLRRLATLVMDDALVLKGSVISEAMRTLDRLDALAAIPEGAHLRSRVDDARKLVRDGRRPARRKKVPTPPTPPAV